MNFLFVKKITQNATLPLKSSKFAAGFDLFSAYNHIVKPFTNKLIFTDLQIKFPSDAYGRIAPRSGLALKGIDIGGGVVDSDYTGNVGIIIFNFSNEDFKIVKGDRVAQLIIEKIYNLDVKECEHLNEKTERGNKGFGSSGT
jgi:dUTP pyrophosphatase